MSNSPGWIKNDQKDEWLFHDGQRFIIAIEVVNNKTGKTRWEIDKVKWSCGGESAEMRYADNDETYDAWDWSCVDYYIEVFK